MICSKDGGVGFKRIDSLCKDAGIEYSYERTSNGFKFIICRPKLIGDVPDVIYGNGEALNVTEQTALAILKRAPTISREEIVERASKTVRTVREPWRLWRKKDTSGALEQRKTQRGKC